MSQGGRSEQVGFLRAAIARIEAAGAGPARFATPGVERGRSLDSIGPLAALPGGALHEIVAATAGDAAAASGFALALAARFLKGLPKTQAGRGPRPHWVWIVEDGARRESGLPYAPGLRQHGLDPARLILLRTPRGEDTLWAMEEALKCRGLAVVVADLWRTRPYDLVASRRLMRAARASATPGVLVLAGAAGQVATLSSAAMTRFEVAAAPSPSQTSPALAGLAGRPPLPGRAAWRARLARIRAGPATPLGQFDQDTFWPLVWDHAEARFCDAFSLPPPALSADGPARAADVARLARGAA